MSDLERHADPAGLVAVVTGASGNLGRALCQRLLAEGGHVVGLVRKPQDAAALEQALSGGPRFRAVVAELSDPVQVDAAFAAADAMGPLWALVNAAGAWRGGKPVHETEPQVLDQLLDANLRSAFLCSRAAMQRLVARGGGRIVNVTSFSAATGQGGANNAAYVATKAGVIALTRALADEGAARGVRCSCIAPGTIHTQDNERAMPGADKSKWVPLEQVVEAVALLCTPGAGGINGAVVTLP